MCGQEDEFQAPEDYYTCGERAQKLELNLAHSCIEKTQKSLKYGICLWFAMSVIVWGVDGV